MPEMPAPAPDFSDGKGLLNYTDYNAVREDLRKKVLSAVATSAFSENDTYLLRAVDVAYAKPKNRFSLAQQKSAILEGRTLSDKVTGRWEVVDKESGKAIGKTGRKTLMNVPYLTDRGTYVRNGSEYTIAKQLRLNSGIYTRVTDDANVEAQFNAMPRSGASFRIYMEPATSHFYMKYKNRKLPLYPILRAMGKQHEDIEAQWGKGIAEKNKDLEKSPYAVNFLKGFATAPEPLEANAPLSVDAKAGSVVAQLLQQKTGAAISNLYTDTVRQGLEEEFGKIGLNPRVTQVTIGEAHSNVSPEAMMSATGKILRVAQGKEDSDSRDSLEFQDVWDISDFLSDKVTHDQNGILRQILWKLTKKNGDVSAVPTAPLDKHVQHLFNSSGMAQTIEEINPLDMYDQNQRILRLGEGAMSSVDVVPKEARGVQPTYLNYIDPVRAPESLKIGVDMKMSRNVRRGPDRQLYSKFIDAKTGKEKWVGIREAARKNLAWPEARKSTEPYVIAMVPNRGMAWVKKEDVDYIVPSNDDMFSDGANLVPLKSGDKGMRLLMGCLHENTDLMIRRDGDVYKTCVGEYTWKEGDETISVNEDTLGTEWSPIAGIKENTQPQQTMLMITLKSGRRVITTDNHKWVTMGPDGKLEEILARDLRKNTPIPRTGDMSHLFGDAQDTSIQLGDLKIDLTDREDGWIFGLYVAEGTLTKINSKGEPCSRISIAGIETFVQDRLRAWCEKKGIRYRLKGNRRYPDGYDNVVNSRELASLFYTHCSSGSYSKKISGTLMNAGRKFREGLVSGYLAGDGGVGLRRGYARVYAGTRSPYLARDFMTLLGTIGIDSTKTSSAVKGAPFYKVEIRPQHISRLPDIGHPRKDERLSKHPTWSGKKDIYWVPKYSELHKKILSCSSRKEQFRHRSYVDQHTRDTLAERLTVDDCPWIGSNVMWDRVASVVEVPESDVTYDLDLGDKVFAVDAGVFVHNSKFGPQALPLVSREAPLVQTSDPSSGTSTERRIAGHLGAVRASGDATVKAVRKNRIDLVYADGTEGSVDLYENFPYARSTYIRNKSSVKAGDRVKKGDLLAASNFTSDKGVAALGTNLRVAYWNYDGLVFEDAIVISEAAAKKLTSEHMYHTKFTKQKDLKVSKEMFRANFPAAFNKDQLAKIDEATGMIKPGSIVRYGDPLALAVSEQDPKEGGSLGRRIRSNKAVVWEKKHPGVVTDATEGKERYYINIRTNIPMGVGDKLAMRHGGKGVISKVVKDSEMPTDPRGRKMDVILSPLGVVSRTNPAQKLEAQLGKIAEKTGKPYILPGFSDEDMIEFTHKELQKHRLSDREDLVDPRTNKKIPQIFTGVTYFYKMQHTSEGKGKSRSQAKYTAEDQPAKGGKTGAKHLGKMYQEALLAHGATEVLKDMKLIKGQKNDMFWRQLKLGQTPTMPKTPLVYEKFKDLIRAGGVHLSEGAFSDDIFSMTDQQAKDLTGNRQIYKGATYTAKGMKPIPGGLFDPDATGSAANGDRWAYIELPTPLPNPIMTDPMRRILGLKRTEMEELIAEGEEALAGRLSKVDVKAEKAKALHEIKHGIRSKRDDAIKKFRFLHAFETNKVTPADFLMTRVPVLPPRFRPIAAQGGMTMVADPNYLYKSLIEAIADYKETDGLPAQMRQEARTELWDSYKALIGTSDPKKDQLVQKNVKGILPHIFGKGSPKTGFIQRRVLGTNIDMAGLGVVAPNPSLLLNQAGIPEKLAWNLYEPFIIRDLVRQGVSATEAATAVKDQSPLAYKALQTVITRRPVILNRAPTLHKYSVMGFWPVLVKGSTVQVPPAIVGPFAMDYDGDTASFTVPVSDEAVSQVIDRMMPDRNLLSARSGQASYKLSNEYLQGLYLATKAPSDKAPAVFNTVDEAKRAYRAGKISIDDPITILN
jgi:DNA-directed RNA polymerase beta subunit